MDTVRLWMKCPNGAWLSAVEFNNNGKILYEQRTNGVFKLYTVDDYGSLVETFGPMDTNYFFYDPNYEIEFINRIVLVDVDPRIIEAHLEYPMGQLTRSEEIDLAQAEGICFD